MARVQELNATVIRREELAPGNIIVRVVPDGWTLPEFTPGQYTVLGLPGTAPRSPLCDPEEKPLKKPDRMIKRAYSVASSSVEAEYLEFYISTVRSGSLTPRLYNLQIGDKVWMSPKIVGYLTLEVVPEDANVVLIATGTGLAPYMSMIRTLASQGGFDRRYAVIHGARHSWDLGYQAELQTLASISPALTYIPIISEPDKEPMEWRGQVGFVKDAWDSGGITKRWGHHPTAEDTHVFLCGNPLMVDSALEFLTAEGWVEDRKGAPGNIHYEAYWK